MKNLISDSLNVGSVAFSLDEFLNSDEPGTLSWLNMETNNQENDNLPIQENESGSIAPPFDSFRFRNQVIPCHRLCAACRRWQMEFSAKVDLSDINNPKTT